MKSMMIPLVMGTLIVPLTSQAADDLDGNNYYKLSLRGDCKIQTEADERRKVEEGPAAYTSSRLTTTNLIAALLAQAGVVADPRRCSIVGCVERNDDLSDVSWYLYCRNGRDAWKYRIDRDVLRVSEGDKSAEVTQRRVSRNGWSSRTEISFMRFDFDTDLLDFFATLYTVEDKRVSGNEKDQSLQSYRMSGMGHHRARIPDVDGSCPGKVRVMLNGRIRNEDMENADHRGTIEGDDPD